MKVHKQYNLLFRIVTRKDSTNIAICKTITPNIYLPLQSELASFINETISYIIALLSQEIQQILNGNWDGFESDGDNIFMTEGGNGVKLDISRRLAYILTPYDGWSESISISIADLKSILDEWIVFRNTVEENN